MMLYPWLKTQWQGLAERQRNDRLPHALLMCGPAGMGKGNFARLFAQALLCAGPDKDFLPCGTCRSCLLYLAGNHPDLNIVGPEEGKSTISINQIRELTQTLSLTGQYGRYRIAIIEPAEKMNTASANGLLKTLEEPGAQTVIMLIASEPHKLLATIRSRCQQVPIALTDKAAALGWLRGQLDAQQSPELLLELAGNAPLRAVALANDDVLGVRRQLWQHMIQLMDGRSSLVSVAEQTLKQGTKSSLSLLWSWVLDMVRCRSGGQQAMLSNPDMAAELHSLARQADLTRLHGMLEKLTNALRLADTQVNEQLLLEDVFIYWKTLFKTS